MIGSKLAQASKDFFWRRPYFPALVAVLPLVVWAGLRSGTPLRSIAPTTEKSPLVSIKMRDAEVRDVLQSFANQIGATLALDPAVRGKLSIQAEKSDLAEVMNDLCEVYSCQWNHANHVLTVSRQSGVQAQP